MEVLFLKYDDLSSLCKFKTMLLENQIDNISPGIDYTLNGVELNTIEFG